MIATVAAGIVFGWHQHVVLPAKVRMQGTAFWRTLVFGLEALVFILIGFSLRGVLDRVGVETVLTTMAVPVLGVVLAVLLARFVWVFGSDGLLAALNRGGLRRARPLGWRQASILAWTGMRGVVTLAVALTLPAQMPGRDLMLVAAFAIILVTVVVQGSSLGWLIRLVRPVDADPPAAIDLAAAEAAIARAKHAEVEVKAYDADGALIHPRLLEEYRRRDEATQRYAGDAERLHARHPRPFRRGPGRGRRRPGRARPPASQGHDRGRGSARPRARPRPRGVGCLVPAGRLNGRRTSPPLGGHQPAA